MFDARQAIAGQLATRQQQPNEKLRLISDILTQRMGQQIQNGVPPAPAPQPMMPTTGNNGAFDSPQDWGPTPETYEPELMPGDGADPRGMFWQEDARLSTPPGASFEPGAEYQTADMSENPYAAVSGQSEFTNKTALNDIAKRQVAQTNAMHQLQMIMDELQQNPGLLDDAHTTRGNLKHGILKFRDRTGIEAFDLTPEQEQSLGDVSSYKQKLLTNVNQYIKDITGAQVGQGQETQRLMAVQPNADDSPAQIVAKLAGAITMARMNVARFKYMQREPGTPAPSDMELRDHLNELGKQYYQEALASGLSPTEARLKASERLEQEFGE